MAHPHLLPHTHADGRIAGVEASGPIATVDTVRLLWEDEAGRFLLLRDGGARRLPGCAASEEDHGKTQDCGNGIKCLSEHVLEACGATIPWMSWIADKHSEQAGAERVDRVYAHRSWDSKKIAWPGADWLSLEELAELPPESLEHEGRELEWARCWVEERDESGAAVRRGYGTAKDAGFGYNGQGHEGGGVTIVGDFTVDGKPSL